MKSTILPWLSARSCSLPFARRWLDRLFAPRCYFCHRALGQDDHGRGDGERDSAVAGVDLCVPCLHALPWADNAGGARVFCAFHYKDPVDAAVRALKFGADVAAARVLGTLLAARVALHAEPARSQQRGQPLLVPVPLHSRRLIHRGFDQAEAIARHAALWLGLDVRAGLLQRVRETESQSVLSAAARRRNVRGAFRVDRQALSMQALALRNRPLVLIDDVVTTGATLAAASAALREVGLRDVECWTVARSDRS